MAQPVTIYYVVSRHKDVDSYDNLPDAKDAAFDYAAKSQQVTHVEKRVEQLMFTYTPQPTPPPVES